MVLTLIFPAVQCVAARVFASCQPKELLYGTVFTGVLWCMSYTPRVAL